MSKQIKIAVKVGVSSDIRFSHAKALRAVTLEELDFILKRNPDISLLVVENILSSEESKLNEIIESFVGQSKDNKVFFYVKDNDDTTCGVADELGLDIYMSLDELHKAIYMSTGLNVSTNIDFRKSITPEAGEMPGFDMEFNLEDSSIDSEIEASGQTIQADESEVYVPDDVEVPVAEAVVEEVKTPSESAENTDSRSEDIYIPSDEPVKPVISVDAYLKEIESLKKVISILENEKAAQQKEWDNLVSSSGFIEEPISMEKYIGLQNENADYGRKLAEASERVDSLSETVQSLQADLADREIQIAEAKEELKQANEKYSVLAKKVESGQVGQVSDDIVKSYKTKIRTLESRIGMMSDASRNLNNTIEELSEQLNSVTSRVDFEVGSRLKLTDVLFSAIKRYKASFDEIEELKKSLSSAEESLSKLKSQAAKKDETIASQSQRIIELSAVESGIQGKIDIAIAAERQKTEEAKVEKQQLESQLRLVNNKLSLKEKQYDELVKKGAGGLGDETLSRINETLKKSNGDLQNRLMKLQADYTQLQSKSQVAVNNYSALEEQNKSLQKIINNSAGTGSVVLPDINYKGRAKIFVVFGSGSYGITTTAVSILHRLTGRNLFIDLDIVNPRADVYFRMSPIADSVPGYRKDYSCTAMGIFFDKGFDFFRTHYDNIVKRKMTTKTGFSDCLSGAYVRPATNKLIKADFQGLLNYLGNSYDNIVIDLGKLGCSDTSDQIIRILCDKATRAFVVTTQDKFDIGMATRQITRLGIKRGNVSWICNLCSTTSIDRDSADRLKPIKVYTIPFENSMFQKHANFFNSSITKGKFNLILEDTGIIHG